MCTLIVWFRVFEQTPLLVAANRDEQLARPSAPPLREVRAGIEVLAPRDRVAGGTWIGVSERGVFSAITNRFGPPPDPARRSRGGLVFQALAHDDANEAAHEIAALDPAEENGFHLVIADRGSAQLVWNAGDRMIYRRLEPGVHVVTERSFDAAKTEREPLIAAKIAALPKPPSDQALIALLATHTESPLDSICVHAEERGYGTKSSTIVRFTEEDVSFEHADGPPCVTPFRAA